jgi:hypothetical protein
MLYAGLDLSRQKLEVHVLDEEGRTVDLVAVRPDAGALRTLAERIARYGRPVEAGDRVDERARFVHEDVETVALADEAVCAFDASYEVLFAELTRLCRALGAGLNAEDVAREALVNGRESLDWRPRCASRSRCSAGSRAAAGFATPEKPTPSLETSIARRKLPERIGWMTRPARPR